MCERQLFWVFSLYSTSFPSIPTLLHFTSLYLHSTSSLYITMPSLYPIQTLLYPTLFHFTPLYLTLHLLYWWFFPIPMWYFLFHKFFFEGMRFGIMQSKVGLVSILKNFKVTLNKKTKEPLVFSTNSIIPQVKGGVWLNLEKI